MRLTASRISLARSCAWWARPDVEVPANDVSSAAAVGTALHAVAEQEAEGVDEVLVEQRFRELASSLGSGTGVGMVEHLNASERVTLDALIVSWREWWAKTSARLAGIETEVPYALALHTGTARQLEKGEARNYSGALPEELCGTADLVAVENKELVVLDYKTGRGPHKWRDHEDQMRFLGAAAALEVGAHQVRTVVVHVTPDEVLVDSRTLDSLDIAMAVYELRELVGHLAGAPARPGLHCEEDWCPAKAVCPVTRSALVAAEVPLDERRRLPLVGPIASNEQAYAVAIAVPLVQAWLDALVKGLKAYADEHGGVSAPDGRVYRGRPVRRESPRLDVTGARTALEQVLGDVAAEAIKTKVSTSWGAIKDALRVRRDRGEAITIADEEEHVRAVLRAAGAIKVSEFTGYEWKKEKTA